MHDCFKLFGNVKCSMVNSKGRSAINVSTSGLLQTKVRSLHIYVLRSYAYIYMSQAKYNVMAKYTFTKYYLAKYTLA